MWDWDVSGSTWVCSKSLFLVFGSVEDTPGIEDARHGKPSRSDHETSHKPVSHRESWWLSQAITWWRWWVIRNSPPQLPSDLRRSGSTLVQDPISTIADSLCSCTILHDRYQGLTVERRPVTHINIIMKPTNPPTQGQPNPRKIGLKVAFGPLFPTEINFSWVRIGFI